MTPCATGPWSDWVVPGPAGSPADLKDRICAQGADIAMHLAFGPSDRMVPDATVANACTPPDGWPLTVVNGADPQHCADGLGGHWALSVSGTPVHTIVSAGRIVARVWQDADRRYCTFGGIRPVDLTASFAIQTLQVLAGAEQALSEAGMTFGHLVRTWFFLDRILDWYDTFNAVRTRFWADRSIGPGGLVPASTGVGVGNRWGAAITMAGVAMATRQGCQPIGNAVPSPLQGAPIVYGSLFSRAVETPWAGRCRRLWISGTASIDARGQSQWTGDMAQQIAHTCAVVKAILDSRAMTWSDVVRGVIYCRDAAARQRLSALLPADAAGCLPRLLVAQATICRDDLTFELEVDAVSETPLPDRAIANGGSGMEGAAHNARPVL